MNSKSIYEAYKKVCPNSTDTFNPTYSNILKWKKHINIYKNNAKIRESNKYQKKEDIDSFFGQAKSRRWDTISDIPSNHMALINTAVDKILHLYPKTLVVYLQGSFVNGTYVDGQTPLSFRQLRTRVTGKVGDSDYDFGIIPYVEQTDFDGTNDLMKPGEKKILIWERAE